MLELADLRAEKSRLKLELADLKAEKSQLKLELANLKSENLRLAKGKNKFYIFTHFFLIFFFIELRELKNNLFLGQSPTEGEFELKLYNYK